MHRRLRALLVFTLVVFVASPASAQIVDFTILHTNDFHGQLEPVGSNPGMARVAAYIKSVRGAVGSDKVLLVDSGDSMQGSLLSNIQKGAPAIAAFNAAEFAAGLSETTTLTGDRSFFKPEPTKPPSLLLLQISCKAPATVGRRRPLPLPM
jgi:hypothetical protein